MRFEELGHTCVVGLQWGDEGKGKVVDLMVTHFDVVVRYNGGANAGHTIVVNDRKFALHQLPTGVLHPNVTSMIGCGSVIDPAVLLGEIESLRQRGIVVGDNLRISDRCQLVFPYHRRQDILAEKAALPGGKIGTTARGIGPCYADKVSRRWGIRVCELCRPDHLRERLASIVAHKNAYLAALYDDRDPFDPSAITNEYLAFAEQLRPFVCDVAVELAERMRRGERVLFEGAQGSLLDIDHGTYPFVTSASTGVGGVASGAGVPPATIGSTVGVLKAYTTRVGEGPFPTELSESIGDHIRQRGREFGTTTGRPRRCGWFDTVAVSYATTLSGPRYLALMHLDTLSGLEELKICVGYRHGKGILNTFPADAYTLTEVEPIYETWRGWDADLSECRRFEDLPPAAQAYVEEISRRVGVPVGVIGVGPQRAQTIFVGHGA
ncbi:MAG: adenylosuccinate synthase [Phycisphaerae bacterium]